MVETKPECLETHDRCGRMEDSKGECVCVRGKIEMILKCVARFRCSVKFTQEKVVGPYTSARTSNKYSLVSLYGFYTV